MRRKTQSEEAAFPSASPEDTSQYIVQLGPLRLLRHKLLFDFLPRLKAGDSWA